MKSSVFILIILCVFSLKAQTKNEKETSISLEQLPINAQVLLAQFPNNIDGIKYYKETDNDKISFEAKFKLEGYYYSVEFNDDGILEDIEQLIKKKYIPKLAFHEIEKHFDARYEKVKYIKIQKQYVNTSNTNNINFVTEALNNTLKDDINYEIIAEVKHNSKRIISEFLFNLNGELILSRELAPYSYDYLLH
jgi:hypothetical protein